MDYDRDYGEKIYNAALQAVTGLSPKDADGLPIVKADEAIDALLGVVGRLAAGYPGMNKPANQKQFVKDMSANLAAAIRAAHAGGRLPDRVIIELEGGTLQ
jgi:hypothetical protein